MASPPRPPLWSPADQLPTAHPAPLPRAAGRLRWRQTTPSTAARPRDWRRCALPTPTATLVAERGGASCAGRWPLLHDPFSEPDCAGGCLRIPRDCPRDYPRLVGARPSRRAAPRRRRAPHRVDRRLRLARAPVLGERAAARAAGRLQMPRRPRRLEITRDYPKDYPGLGSNCLVVGHANGLRALVACVQQNVDDESLPSLGLPNGLPLIYELEPDGGVCGGHCTCPGHVLDMSETCMDRQRAAPERGALLRAAVAGLLLGRRVPRLQRPRPGPVGRTQQRRAARRVPRLVRQHRRRRRRAGTTSTPRRPPPHL